MDAAGPKYARYCDKHMALAKDYDQQYLRLTALPIKAPTLGEAMVRAAVSCKLVSVAGQYTCKELDAHCANIESTARKWLKANPTPEDRELEETKRMALDALQNAQECVDYSATALAQVLGFTKAVTDHAISTKDTALMAVIKQQGTGAFTLLSAKISSLLTSLPSSSSSAPPQPAAPMTTRQRPLLASSLATLAGVE